MERLLRGAEVSAAPVSEIGTVRRSKRLQSFQIPLQYIRLTYARFQQAKDSESGRLGERAGTMLLPRNAIFTFMNMLRLRARESSRVYSSGEADIAEPAPGS